MSRNFEVLQRLGREQDLLQEGATDESNALDVEAIVPSQTGEDPSRVPSKPSDQFDVNLVQGPTSAADEAVPALVRKLRSEFQNLRHHTLARDTSSRRKKRPAISLRERWQLMRSQAIEKEQLDNADMAHEEEVRLVQRVFLAKRRKPSRLVAFCGVERGNGCSRVCARAGEVLAAQVKGTVCVVDANLRSPSLHRYFELDNGRGFTEAMLECGPWREYAHQLMDSNLHVVTSGTVPTDPHSLLTSENVHLRIRELQGSFDYILFDTSAASRYTDAALLGSASDGVVLVMEANRTRRETAKRVKDDLTASKSRILAAVLNKRTFPIPEAIYRIL